jgi:hypothetical protein
VNYLLHEQQAYRKMGRLEKAAILAEWIKKTKAFRNLYEEDQRSF